jgi:molecular chaperone GrpE (heat shock protein)
VSAEGGSVMKIDVQEELKRFQPFETDGNSIKVQNLMFIVNSIMAQFRELKKADIKIIGGFRDLAPKIAAAVNVLLEEDIRRVNQEAGTAKTDQIKDKVLLSIYDRLKNRLNAASAWNNRTQMEVYRKLLEDVESLFAEELEWVPLESVGKSYNPFEYDGFITADRSRYAANRYQPGEIVSEIRTGFSCRGRILRKPVVEFYE